MIKGSTHSDVTKELMSISRKGNPSPNKGKRASEITIKRLSESHMGQIAWNKGIKLSQKHKRNLSIAHKGKTLSQEHIDKIIEGRKNYEHSDTTKKKIGAGNTGKKRSEIAKRKVSATKQGIPYDEWERFAKYKKYCPKYNEECKEANRNKYGRLCFVCNKSEIQNGEMLSVHHVDMDKAQGCDSNWKLVPLCRPCHAKAHNDELIARLGYLLKDEVRI